MSAQLVHEGTQATTAPVTTPAGRGRLRGALHQIRLAVAETTYAARRVVEIQAPWTVDEQWHTR